MSANVTNENIVQFSSERNASETFKYSPIEQAIDDIRNGKLVIIADDGDRENEGGLICSAEKTTAAMINFMMMHARGMIRVTMTPERAAQLRLTQNGEDDIAQNALTISVDAGFEFGVSNGLSAADRATTVQRLAAPNATALDFRRPGHTFPVTGNSRGVFRRVGHVEAVIDLTRLAGHTPMGVLCEILNDDGSIAQRDDLAAFAKKHGLSFVTIAQLIQYRLKTERTVTRRVVKEVDTRFGTFTAVGYKDAMDNCEHLAFVKGSLENLQSTIPFVRVQHENVLTDLLGKSGDGLPREMEEAMKFIQNQESGVVVYLRHSDDSANGLLGSLKAYQKEASTMTTPAYANQNEMREYGVEAQILSDLGVGKFKRLGKEAKKIVALRGYGLEVVDTVSLSSVASSQAPQKSLPLAEQAPEVDYTTKVETVTETFVSPVTVTVTETFVSPVTVTDEVVTPAPQNQNTPAQPVAPAAPTETIAQSAPELKAEPRIGTMKMGGQVINGQALFEG